MGKKKGKRNEILDSALSVTAGGLTLGVGAGVVTSAGGNAAGIQAFSRFQRPIGATVGAKITLKKLKKLK